MWNVVVYRLSVAVSVVLALPCVSAAQHAQARGAAQDLVGSLRPTSVGEPSIQLDKDYRITNTGAGRAPSPTMLYYGQYLGVQGFRSMFIEICELQFFTTALSSDTCTGGLSGPRVVDFFKNIENLREQLPMEPPPGKAYFLIWREKRAQALDRPGEQPCQERVRLPATSQTRICGWSSPFNLLQP